MGALTPIEEVIEELTSALTESDKYCQTGRYSGAVGHLEGAILGAIRRLERINSKDVK